MATHPGIEVRHATACASRSGRRCTCKPTYQAHVWSARDGKRIRKTFKTLAETRAWRQEAQVALRRRTMKAPSQLSLRGAAEAWLAGAEEGTIRNRSGDRYKPSVLRGYEQALRNRILPEFGGARLGDVTRADLQDFADQLLAEGLDPSTIRNTLLPLRALFRRAVTRGDVAVSPTAALELPAVRGRRDRIASPAEAERLLDALATGDRALWATAFYAGLRLGELRALRYDDIDLVAGVIRVRRSWDQRAGEIAPKSRAGVRDVPIPGVLRAHLAAHRLAAPSDAGLVFGRSPSNPFNPATVNTHARRAWRSADLTSIGLHEARHTYASLMIAAGVNAKALATYLGHSSVTITFDRYGHLMPGNADEAAALLDAYLEHGCPFAERPSLTTRSRARRSARASARSPRVR